MERYLLDMFSLNNREIVDPTHAQFHGVLTDNLSTLEHHLRFSARYLPSDNVLVKLLNGLSFSGEDAFEVWLKNQTLGRLVAKSIGITTDTTKGRHLNNAVLQHKGNEYLFIRQDKFPDNTDWTTWEPIRIESHSYYDLTWDYLVSDINSGGDAVISIDVGLLALMWWHYCHSTSAEERRRPEEWLFQYPLVNGIQRYGEIAILNRLVNSWLYGRLDKDNFGLGWVTLLNAENSFHRYQQSLERRLERSAFHFGDYLNSVSLFEMTPSELLLGAADVDRTLTNRWVLLFADSMLLDKSLAYWGEQSKGTQRWAQYYARQLRIAEAMGAFEKGGSHVESTLHNHLDIVTTLAKT